MKQFKLIKEYPASPKLGYKIKFPFNNDEKLNLSYYNHGWFDPRKFPQNWQEVIKKDYEILIFVSSTNSNIRYKKDSQLKDTYCSINGKAPFHSLADMLIEPSIKIYSIKRLSDGEIFTIDDDTHLTGKIKYFEIDKQSNLLVVGFNDGEDVLEFLKKAKQPLFTTEDGVDIYNGIRFWNVSLFYNLDEFQITNDKYPLKFIKDGSNTFSTKEKAEEYILLNKPCLSINDILSKTEFPGNWDKTLKELVKSKL